MLFLGTIILLFAILFGYRVLRYFLRNEKPPKRTVLVHGIFALTGILILMGYVALGHRDTILVGSLVLFCLAAAGGMTMAFMSMKHKTPPKIFLFFHPLITLSAFITLIIYFVQHYSAA